MIGSLIFFIFSKLFLKTFFSKFYIKYSNKINEIIKNSSYEYLILLRFSFFPLIVQNICLSILNISKIKNIKTTFIGCVPMMILTAFVGNEFSNFIELKNYNIKDLFSSKFLLIIFLLILIIFLRIFFKKK